MKRSITTGITLDSLAGIDVVTDPTVPYGQVEERAECIDYTSLESPYNKWAAARPRLAVHPDFLPVLRLGISRGKEINAFLAEIKAGNAAAVGIFADWLEERSSPLAEKLRDAYAHLSKHDPPPCHHCGSPHTKGAPGASVRCLSCGQAGPNRVRWFLLHEVLRMFGAAMKPLPDPVIPPVVQHRLFGGPPPEPLVFLGITSAYLIQVACNCREPLVEHSPRIGAAHVVTLEHVVDVAFQHPIRLEAAMCGDNLLLARWAAGRCPGCGTTYWTRPFPGPIAHSSQPGSSSRGS